jgi:hypothetical protein
VIIVIAGSTALVRGCRMVSGGEQVSRVIGSLRLATQMRDMWTVQNSQFPRSQVGVDLIARSWAFFAEV